MTTVIKAKKPVRAKSLSSVLTQAFAKHRKSANGRTITVACTPAAFVEHGTKWVDIAKAEVAKIAKGKSLTIASWEADVVSGSQVLKVHFNEALAAFHKDFQADLYHDLIDPEYKGNFEVVKVECKGNENSGTLLVEIDTSKFDYATSRAELKRVMDNLFNDTYHKRITGMGNMKCDTQDHRILSITYKDVPF